MLNSSTIEVDFSPMTAEQEYSLLTEDDQEFPNTKIYLRGLILEVLDHSDLPQDIYDFVYHQLIADVPIAARRFMTEEGGGYRFSTYFTWYIQQRLNSVDDLARRGMTGEK